MRGQAEIRRVDGEAVDAARMDGEDGGGSGDGEFAVGLRSAVVRGNRAWLFAGNGIMGDSNPQSEFDEVQLKYRPLGEALGA